MYRRNGRRKESRAALEASARGETFPVRLYDVSLTGCKLDCSQFELSEGEEIVIKFSSEIELHGTIVWRRRGSAGVHFDSTLPRSIAAHLHLDPANRKSTAA